ncbi:hypothetical protein IV102_26350 [bacterium]|nr:hypothetical protein [bacterium]
MDSAATVKCRECGSHLEGRVSPSGLVTCSYCGTGYDLRALNGRGPALISRADFSGSCVTGWRLGSPIGGKPVPGAWSITQPNDGQNHPLLVAPGAYDDFEVAITFRFVSAGPEDFVFFRSRGGAEGAMTLHLWRQGSVALRWQMPDHQWQNYIVTTPPGPPKDTTDWRQLRWIATGQRHRAYLDGTLVISAVHPSILHSGHLDLRIQAKSPSVTIEISDLALFEPPSTSQ